VSRLEQLIAGGESGQPRSDDDHFFPGPACFEMSADSALNYANIIPDGMLCLHNASDERKKMTYLI
jgi:hypothetical protein